ncbi:MAG: hypothetical protein ACE37N_08480 [Pseudohongiellaceae bacterium]
MAKKSSFKFAAATELDTAGGDAGDYSAKPAYATGISDALACIFGRGRIYAGNERLQA